MGLRACDKKPRRKKHKPTHLGNEWIVLLCFASSFRSKHRASSLPHTRPLRCPILLPPRTCLCFSSSFTATCSPAPHQPPTSKPNPNNPQHAYHPLLTPKPSCPTPQKSKPHHQHPTLFPQPIPHHPCRTSLAPLRQRVGGGGGEGRGRQHEDAHVGERRRQRLLAVRRVAVAGEPGCFWGEEGGRGWWWWLRRVGWGGYTHVCMCPHANAHHHHQQARTKEKKKKESHAGRSCVVCVRTHFSGKRMASAMSTALEAAPRSSCIYHCVALSEVCMCVWWGVGFLCE